MKINNTIFMTIPIEIEYEEMGLTSNEEKQEFVDKFLKEVINLPLLQVFNSTNNLENSFSQCMGVITEGKQTDDYNINLFAMCVANVNTEYIQIPTTEDNFKEPIGKRLKINGVGLEFKSKENKHFFELSQLQRDIANKIKNNIKD